MNKHLRPNYIEMPHVVTPAQERKAEHFNDNFRAIANAVERKLDELDRELDALRKR